MIRIITGTTVKVLALLYHVSILTEIYVILYLFCRAFCVLQIYSSVKLCLCDNMAGSKLFAVIMRGKKPTLLVLCNFIEILGCGVNVTSLLCITE